MIIRPYISEWVRDRWAQPRYSYAIVTGICLGIGFLLPYLWWLGFVGIALSIRSITLARSVRKVVSFTLFSWCIKYVLVLAWTVSAYPFGWIGPLPFIPQLIVVAGFWVTGALWLSVGGALFAVVSYSLYNRPAVSRFIWYLSLPFLWLAAELGSAFFFSLMTYGPGSSLQTYFSFGMMGYLLIETWLGIALAGIVGVYGLSVIAVCGGVGLCLLTRVSRPQQIVLGGGSVLLIMLVILYGQFAEPSLALPPLLGYSVVSVDTSFPPGMIDTTAGLEQKSDALEEAINAALLIDPDYILLSEEARLLASSYSGYSPTQALNRFLFTHQNTRTILIDNGRVDLPESGTHLRGTVFDGQNKKVYQFDKQYLVPQGEYIPYLYAGILRIVGLGSLVNKLETDSSYEPGPLVQGTMTDVPENIPGLLFCFEGVRPGGVGALIKNHPVPFIAHPISHSWFHQSAIMEHQLDSMLIVQARSTGIPIVSAGNVAAGKLYRVDGLIDPGTQLQTGQLWQLRKFEL